MSLSDAVTKKDSPQDNLQRLREHALFRELSNREFDKFARVCNLRNYETGEIIYRKNYPHSVLFLIVQGRVELHQEESLESPMIGWANESEYLGVVELLTQTSRAESALARTPVALYAVSDHDFFAFIDLYPRIGNRLLLNLGRELSRRLLKETEVEA